LIDTSGSKHSSGLRADVTNDQVAEIVNVTLDEIGDKNDRGFAMDVMMRGAGRWLVHLYSEGNIHGVIGIGGSAGTTIGAYAMRALPVGVPKLQVSTVASGDTRPYVGTKDITMMYSVVDVAGLNSISMKILSNAANAITGMVKAEKTIEGAKPLISTGIIPRSLLRKRSS
jgi:uncharacterized protein (UPF0261 family)